MKVDRWNSSVPTLLARCVVILSLCGFIKPVEAQLSAHPVISEVYGGGGNSGSTYKNDFVELYNPTAFTVTMTRWSVQYQSATNTGSAWQKTVISGTIPSHHFFLVQEAEGSGGTTGLPAPDASGSISLGSTGGKVALVDDTVAISGPAGANVVDFVGYGSANQFEGTAPAGSLSNTKSAERKAQAASTIGSMSDGGIDSLSGNGWDSGDNRSDFVIAQTQGPQNLSFPAEVPPDSGDITPPVSYEAVASGKWSDTNTWSSHSVPSDSSNVTFSAPGVTVTIDLPDARCKNLTLSGSGTSLGPTLRFDSSGAHQLTINGNLAISGGSGSGQGGRAKLTSNGNIAATLIVKRGIFTTSSNILGNGSAGLNMNEGFVKLVGSTSDTLRNSAGLRLGNLLIGDGLAAKTFVWAASKKTTLVLRSLTVKSHSTFLIGDAADTNSGDIGNLSASGVPTLTGGINVEGDAGLIVQASPGGGGHGAINLDAGGITNDGTILLRGDPAGDLPRASFSPASTAGVSGPSYKLNIGGLPAGADSSSQSIRGTRSAGLADIVVAEGHTLRFERAAAIPDPFRITLNGTLVETPGQTVAGRIEATRVVSGPAAQDFGGIGCVIAAAGAAPGSTTVVRVSGVASGPTILRYFDIVPTVNGGLDAALDFSYDNSELNGQDARSLRLWRSGNGGTTWSAPAGSVVDTMSHRVHLGGINSFSRWTASDAAHVPGNSSLRLRYALSGNWNLVSFPLRAADPSRAALFPASVSPAFRYGGSYIVSDSLLPGAGYWMRFPAAETDTIEGVPESLDSVTVTDGWNLIGSPAFSMPGSQVVQIPPGIVTSNYFGYENGYTVAGTLEPGKGYWVKIAGGGKLFFPSQSK